ncbi:hypothetical protein EDC04DRAFT_1593989 [Pisolithus marmoratus]|nr:hypothetical protein EDC04DRAFT_1593989 [Pisolithus marmoratus]
MRRWRADKLILVRSIIQGCVSRNFHRGDPHHQWELFQKVSRARMTTYVVGCHVSGHLWWVYVGDHVLTIPAVAKLRWNRVSPKYNRFWGTRTLTERDVRQRELYHSHVILVDQPVFEVASYRGSLLGFFCWNNAVPQGYLL